MSIAGRQSLGSELYLTRDRNNPDKINVTRSGVSSTTDIPLILFTPPDCLHHANYHVQSSRVIKTMAHAILLLSKELRKLRKGLIWRSLDKLCNCHQIYFTFVGYNQIQTL